MAMRCARRREGGGERGAPGLRLAWAAKSA